MQKSITSFLSLTIMLLFISSFNVDVNNPKKQVTYKIQDTLKKTIPVTEVKTTDTIVEYKGKFKPYKKGAHASYYADRFHGKKTASGKIFDMNKLTAAHKKLPFGTKVKVTNEANGKIVFVEITDRGPFVKGREIDLSKKAFMTISGNKNSGKAIVTLEILQK